MVILQSDLNKNFDLEANSLILKQDIIQIVLVKGMYNKLPLIIHLESFTIWFEFKLSFFGQFCHEFLTLLESFVYYPLKCEIIFLTLPKKPHSPKSVLLKAVLQRALLYRKLNQSQPIASILDTDVDSKKDWTPKAS